MNKDLSLLAANEEIRRTRRNLSDRLARRWINEHPEIKEDPENCIVEDIPEGTSESTIRAIARFYKRKKLVREVLRERNYDDSTGT